ncbi:unnamed protein product [Didymodactylos carnosus]|uniref:Uncharacterized protein n=1 Tax=Didymodactylos carnosus TaxID=1234261 RepID=A0A813Y2G4_9BILA|nr:unnamed protein product [Didymodactylos carnosus]CAF3661344.1 unnamed protein product [Didymodactylos carnosus]
MLRPDEALNDMGTDFESLMDHLDRVKNRHAKVCTGLEEQARCAKKAKERNDERAKQAEELKVHAKISAVLSIPGVSLLGAPVATAMICANGSSDEEQGTGAKILKGAGGALLGVGLGVVLTAISPFLLGYSAICGAKMAVLSKSWSRTFKDIEGQIGQVQDLIEESSERLNDIKSSLTDLKLEISKCNPLVRPEKVLSDFENILNSSIDLQLACDNYENNLKSKQLKQIVGMIKK